MKIRKLLGERGFTLVEIMIVVAIIGLLAAIAIPNFMKAREKAQQNACIANLRQMEGAKTLYALDAAKGTGASVSWANLVTDYLKSTPSCPAGGTYTIQVVGTKPTCTVSGHEMPPFS